MLCFLGSLLVPSPGAPDTLSPPRPTQTLPAHARRREPQLRGAARAPCRPIAHRLAAHLPVVVPNEWLARMLAGDVVDAQGQPVRPSRWSKAACACSITAICRASPELPFEHEVLYQNEHLLVADKPHFMPVHAHGALLQQSLLVRLKRQLGLPDYRPLHRIDRDTAGLVLFLVSSRARGARTRPCSESAVWPKTYDAVAPRQC